MLYLAQGTIRDCPMRWLSLAFFLMLAACAVREEVDFVQGPAPGAAWRPVLVATTRAPDADLGVPGHLRADEVSFGRYVVSIPPRREPGAIPRQRNRQRADPERHFMLAESRQLQPMSFEAAIRAELMEQPPAEREVTIFIHGFNTTFIEGVYRTAQLDHDLRLPGVIAHYSWPSLGAPLAYAHDRDSALFARDGLIEMIHRAQAAGPNRIILIAHSMGSHVLMESLRQMALARDPAMAAIGGVILIAPDLDVELFHQQARSIPQLPQPFLIVVSQRDRVLNLSARLTGQPSRLGNITSAEPIADLPVTVIDVSAFGSGDGHFTVGSSPVLVSLLGNMRAVNVALNSENAGALTPLPATILTLQNTTEVILSLPIENRRRLILPWWVRGDPEAQSGD